MYSNALTHLVHALVLSPQTRIIVPSALLYVFPQTLRISFETSFVQHSHYYTLGDVSICSHRPLIHLNAPASFDSTDCFYLCRDSPFYVAISPCINPHNPGILHNSPGPKVEFRDKLLLTAFGSDLLKYT